jgi:hypothetical protein
MAEIQALGWASSKLDSSPPSCASEWQTKWRTGLRASMRMTCSLNLLDGVKQEGDPPRSSACSPP